MHCPVFLYEDAIFPLEFANYNFPFLYGRGKEIRQLETIFWGDDIHLAGTELIDHCIIQVSCLEEVSLNFHVV